MKKSKLMEFIQSIVAIIMLILLIAIPSLILLWIYSKLNINIYPGPSMGPHDHRLLGNIYFYFGLPICLLYYIPVNRWINHKSEKITKEKENKEINDETQQKNNNV